MNMLHIMDISRSQNKIIILAWLCRFNVIIIQSAERAPCAACEIILI